MKNIKTIFSLLILFFSWNMQAQERISPASFRYGNLSWNVPRIELAALDQKQLAKEDSSSQKDGNPLKVGVMRNLYYGMGTVGRVDLLPDGGKLWRLEIQSLGARSLSLHIANARIPEEAFFYIYGPNREVVEEISRKGLTENPEYYTADVAGDALILEYYEPASADFPGDFEIVQVGHNYRATPFTKGQHGDAEGDCHIDVSCPEGEAWADQANAVVLLRMTTSNAIFLCSGAMVNNIRQDGTPYVLTADHCGETGVTSYRFYFQYQATSCGSASGFQGYSVLGGSILARANYISSSDFMLMEITGYISEYIRESLYLAGWDVSGTTPASGVCIHHPNGDFKKISIPQSITPGTGSHNKYWQTNWYGLSNNKGVTEGGSSGSPLFDANKRIVGQLYGGSSFCEFPQYPDYYGKLSNSWTNGNVNNNERKLQPWLDPDNTGLKVIDGIYLKALGVEEHPAAGSHSLKIYPNPSSGKITLKLQGLSGKAQCAVFDMMGRRVHVSEFQVGESNTLDLSSLGQGIYMIQIKDGKSLQTSKLIISE